MTDISLTVSKERKPSGIKANGMPNASWRKFEERVKAFESIPLEQWGSEQLLGYMLQRYEKHYGICFAFSYYGPPTKSQELYCIERIKNGIGTQKGWILKDYIDWVFDSVIKPQKVKVETLAFFFAKNLCAKYRLAFANRQKITRSTPLPDNYITEIEPLGLGLTTYGDLAFAKMAISKDPTRDDAATYNSLFERLSNLGFNEAILESLEN